MREDQHFVLRIGSRLLLAFLLFLGARQDSIPAFEGIFIGDSFEHDLEWDSFLGREGKTTRSDDADALDKEAVTMGEDSSMGKAIPLR